MIDKSKLPKPNLLDKAIAQIAPRFAVRRYRSRIMFSLAGGYIGASKRRRSMSQWSPGGADADGDILPDLPTLYDRSRDLIRNFPIATGIINTKKIEVVGSGLKHQSRIDREVLNLTEEQATEKEKEIEREWDLFWNTIEVDAARTLNGDGQIQMVYGQEKENGDVIILLPRFKRAGSPYSLKLQIVEADRLCNENHQPNTNRIAGGIKKDSYGAPLEYHILEQHPGNRYMFKGLKWKKIPAFGSKTGLRNVIHYFHPTRPGQSRGVPDLAPVVELIKTLGSYTTNEAVAAEIASLFTVFIKSATGDIEFDITNTKDETGAKTTDKDMKLGSGVIVGLAEGEEIQTANPGRPNTAFDGFILAISRQIGAAVNLPYEILVKHFTSSYSAARAALLTAWKYFTMERKWLSNNFCQVVKEIWMYEAVAIGRISAPGFFTNPIIRKAYCNSVWTGPAKGMIDELKEVNAAEKRINIGISTIQEETTQMTGGDFDRNHPQRTKEHNMRKEAGLSAEKGTPAAPSVPEKKEDEDEEDEK